MSGSMTRSSDLDDAQLEGHGNPIGFAGALPTEQKRQQKKRQLEI